MQAALAVGTQCLRSSGLNFHHCSRKSQLPLINHRGARSSGLPLQAISSNQAWNTTSVLLASAAFGIWSEKETQWGRALSGALISTLVGLAASNAGLIPSQSPVYALVNTYLLPLSLPLLLFSADLKRLLTATGHLLLVFCMGSAATILGTIVAMKLVPLKSLGPDAWKIAAALMSRHIGGAVNYVAVSEALGTSPSMVASGLAADNLICAIYFTSLFALASSIPAEDQQLQRVSSKSLQFNISDSIKVSEDEQQTSQKGNIKVREASIALAISAAMCAAGVSLANFLRVPSGSIAVITALVVVAATLFPAQLGKLVTSGEGLASILMQIFFASVGANGSISAVISTAPSLFLFCLVQIGVHLAALLGIGKLLGIEKRYLLLASNANVGGPTTAAGMATAKGWISMVVPGVLAGIFGITIATFVSIALGMLLLRKL